jgi:hypothetical protein
MFFCTTLYLCIFFSYDNPGSYTWLGQDCLVFPLQSRESRTLRYCQEMTRDHQEDLGSKSARANSSQDPISKKPFTKKGWWIGWRCRPWVQAPALQYKTKQNKKIFTDTLREMLP